ncbi:putative sugar transporter [Xylaria arbuscula]|nr:putative sugar transporter [Xylaria arbuscula]
MVLENSMLAKYIRNIRSSPRALIANHHLLLTCALFSLAGVPLCWDQGSSATIPSLPGFQRDFGITSATNPGQVSNFVTLIYIGAGTGAGLSALLNDRIGRLWSLRLYSFIWIIGQLIVVGSRGNIATLYAGRIVSGFGTGPLTVIGPVSLVEIAPSEIRGLLTSWFSISLLLSLFVAAFTVYGCLLNVATSTSFFVCESPRWLFLEGRDEEGTRNLVKLRGLPLDHPRLQSELQDIQASVLKEKASFGAAKTYSFKGLGAVFREIFLVKANLRRTQQACISYALAQLSGANSITTYLVPVLGLIGIKGDAHYSLLVAALYSMSKFFYTVIASFLLIDAIGRRNSLFTGIIIQGLSDIYIGIYVKFNQAEGSLPTAAGQAALAAIFLHGFGYAIGLLVLPYVFVSELWPNHIRSFGAALTQFFHWWFFFGVNKGIPSLLEQTNNWGAFIFFAAWCFLALIYTFCVVPETAGVPLEKLDELFEGPWWNTWKRSKTAASFPVVIEGSNNYDTDSRTTVESAKQITKDIEREV